MKQKLIIALALLFSFISFSQTKIDELGKKFKETEELNYEKVKNSNFVKKFIKNNDLYELQFIEGDTTPVYYQTFNVAASKSTRVNHLNTGGSLGLNLNGQDINYYIWDGGHVLTTHQELVGRVSVNDVVEVSNYHATHVGGTIGSTGISPLSKGMAPLSNIKSYDWNSDLTESTTAVNYGMLLSNHSYGFAPLNLPDYYFGGYISTSRNWDLLLYQAPYYLMCVAAGNDGATTYNDSPLYPSLPQYDKLTGHAVSKNNLVVASSEDAVIDDAGNLVSVDISSFSSQGPTDDLRIKPDITGNGRGLYSTDNTSNTSYRTLSGTSMATPNVVGTLGLIQQHSFNTSNSYLKSATLKGLTLHTADDAGSIGPDVNFGWGLLNSKKAIETLNQNLNTSIVKELRLSEGQTYSLIVSSDNINTLKASISWTDPAGISTTILNSSTPVLVNDLDIIITKNGETYYPWSLTSATTNTRGNDNFRDPYERVDVDNPNGDYLITISHKGSLSFGFQNFSLIVTGIVNVSSSCSLVTPSSIYSSDVSQTSGKINWNFTMGGNYEVRYKKIVDTTWINVVTANTNYIIQGLVNSTQYEVQIRTICGVSTSNFSTSLLFTTLNECDPLVPANIVATNVTSLFATISWSSVLYTTYVLRYKPVSSVTWTELNLNETSKILSGLSPSTQYEVQVKSLCSNGNSSTFSNSIIFTTKIACTLVPPTNLTASNVTNNSVTMSWSPVSGAVSYQLRWQVQGSLNYTLTNINTTTYTVMSLVQGTTYELSVQTICENSLSTFSPIVLVTIGTPITCTPIVVTNLVVNNIGNTNATINWSGINISYLLKYKQQSSSVWNELTAVNLSYTLTNLISNTLYDVEVRGRCSDGSVSLPTLTQFTTTTPTPIICVATTPTGLFLSGTNTITWDVVPQATYQIDYTKTKGKPTWIRVLSNINTITLNNLATNQTYKAKVRSLCSNGVTSDWSTNLNFTSNSLLNYGLEESEVVYIKNDKVLTNFEYENIIVYNIIGQVISKTNDVSSVSGVIIVKIDGRVVKLIK